MNLPAPGGAAQISRTPRSFLLRLLQGVAPLLIQCGQSWDTTAESIKTNLNMLTAAILLLFHQVDV